MGAVGADASTPRIRRPLILLGPATFFEGYDVFLLALALPLIRAEFAMSVGEAGALASIAFSGGLGGLVLIALADRWGRRRVLAISIAGYTLATFATAFSRGVVDLASFQFVARAFLGAEFGLATILLVELVSERRRGRQLGILSSMSAFGHGAAGAGFLAVVATGASWRVLYLVGILPLVLVAWARRGLPETVRPRNAPGRLRGAVDVRSLVGAGAFVLLFTLATTALTTFASLLVLDEWGVGLDDLHPAYAAAWVFGASGFFVGGRLLDTWGRRPTAVTFLLGAAATEAVVFTSASMPVRLAGLGVVVFFISGSLPCMAAFSTEPFAAEVRGRVNAFLRAGGIAATAAAPALAGVASESLGSVGGGLAALGGAYVLAALAVSFLLPEVRGRISPPEPRLPAGSVRQSAP